jgi:hypothetical protein
MARHRLRRRLGRLVAVPVAVFALPVAFLLVALNAVAETRQPVANPLVCEPSMEECESSADPSTDPGGGAEPSEEPPSDPSQQSPDQPVPPPPAAGGGGGSGGSGGGSGGGSRGGSGGGAVALPTPAPIAASVSPAYPSLSATPASSSAGATQAASRDLAQTREDTMPSAMLLGSTAGILIAFVVAVAFLIRERRLQREELEELELEHWRTYR